MEVAVTPGDTIQIVVSDPFELSGRWSGEVASLYGFAAGADREMVLVRLFEPVNWSASAYGFVVLQRRSSPGLLQELELGQAVEVNGIGILAPEQEAPWGAHDWRGGLAFIGSARLTAVPA